MGIGAVAGSGFFRCKTARDEQRIDILAQRPLDVGQDAIAHGKDTAVGYIGS